MRVAIGARDLVKERFARVKRRKEFPGLNGSIDVHRQACFAVAAANRDHVAATQI